MDVTSATSSQTTDVYTVQLAHRIEPGHQAVEADLGLEQTDERIASKSLIEKQIHSMNELLLFNNTTLKFHLHEDLNRLFVQVINRDTEEVVKEIPPEKFLDMVAAMLKHAGLLVDKRV